ncbi:uncharacterized protein LOC124373566 [Homalodisca vitripennis]|uniref:uncharacterized protein LOC124373566 n=1 Tax=Homalodisca vitripennis TaxID=197043 RepID=UPI001EEA8F82|nr:uncharacterized protein LOC124373566 [Homalodisca vitripennis]
MTGPEICGHVDVKVPSKGRKFGQWKAWRRQWCIVRYGHGSTLQLVLGSGHNNPTSCIDIPYNAIICRSESRSRQFAFGVYSSSSIRQPIVFLAARSETEAQQWMLRIRNLISPPKIPATTWRQEKFSVSLIDNAHSRIAGLAGLFGTMSVGLTGITINDPVTGQIRMHWRWSQVNGITLRLTSVAEDVNHILVLHTSSEFSCGEGLLELFCLEGVALMAHLSLYQNKPSHRLTTSPLPPIPRHPLLAFRRLSRSEGDLRRWLPLPDANFHLRTQSVSRTRVSHDKFIEVQHSFCHRRERENTTHVTAAAFFLFIVTAVTVRILFTGAVIADVYYHLLIGVFHQPFIFPSIQDYILRLGLMLTTPGCSEPDSLHDYQCLDTLWPDDFDTLSDLPDIRRYQNNARRESGVSIASGIYEEIEEQPNRKHELSGSEEEYCLPEEALIYSVANENEEEPLYLPMSPGGRKEDTYVVMANLIHKNNAISEPVI